MAHYTTILSVIGSGAQKIGLSRGCEFCPFRWAPRAEGANGATGYFDIVAGFVVMRSVARRGMRPYKELGNLLASLARKYHAQDNYAIARRIEEVAGYKVSPHTITEYLYGSSLPEPEFFRAFAEAFSLSVEERRDLAWVHSYGYILCQETSLSFTGELE